MADVDALGLDDGGDGGDGGGDWVDAYLDWGGDWGDFACVFDSSDFSLNFSDVSSGASYADTSLAWNSSDSAAISASTTMDQGFGFSDWVQTALNVAGNIPEIGAAANGLNAGISLLRGNYTQAAMYGTAAALSVFVPGGAAIAKGGGLMVDALEAEEAAEAASSVLSATEETTTLYRVVGPDELSSLEEGRGYTGSPGGLESKYFYPTADQASNFAAHPSNTASGPFTLTSTEIPTSMISPRNVIPVMGEGTVVTIPNELLPHVPRPTIWNYIPLPSGAQ